MRMSNAMRVGSCESVAMTKGSQTSWKEMVQKVMLSSCARSVYRIGMSCKANMNQRHVAPKEWPTLS